MSPQARPYPAKVIDDAIEAILVYYSALEAPINHADLLDRSRDAYTIKVRSVVMWFLKTEGHLSYPVIGKRFQRDHTSVINLVRRAHNLETLETLEDVAEFAKERVASRLLTRHAALMDAQVGA